MKQSEHREKPIKRRRVQRNRRAEDRKIEQEKAKLQDPKNIENVAREQLGLVKPGEVPYVK